MTRQKEHKTSQDKTRQSKNARQDQNAPCYFILFALTVYVLCPDRRFGYFLSKSEQRRKALDSRQNDKTVKPRTTKDTRQHTAK